MVEGEVLEGGCLCGAIRYRIAGPSLFVSQCCCKDCQKATGTGHTTIIGIHTNGLHGPLPWSTYNAFTRITPERLSQIHAWIGAN